MLEFVDASDPDPQNEIVIETSTTSFTLDQVILLDTLISSENLEDAYCYPSPARLTTDGGDTIKFANFAPYTTINILSPAGYTVKKLTADSAGRILPPWDGKDDNGNRVGTGTYIVHARDPNGNTKVFNILIIQ